MPSEILKANFPEEDFSIRRLSGGDINDAYRATSDKNDLCIKLNSATRFPQMFKYEAAGLQLLAETNSIKVPGVVKFGKDSDQQYLIMEFVKGGLRSTTMWESFGHGLAKLHQCTANDFGLDHTNFIGSLQQQNERKTTWTDFLLTQRFEPMLKMAMDSGHISSSELAQFSKFERHAVDIWPEEPPALLHGDLWSGNYLPAENDEPCIIDPAVYYGHREIDIGMMHLFRWAYQT